MRIARCILQHCEESFFPLWLHSFISIPFNSSVSENQEGIKGISTYAPSFLDTFMSQCNRAWHNLNIKGCMMYVCLPVCYPVSHKTQQAKRFTWAKQDIQAKRDTSREILVVSNWCIGVSKIFCPVLLWLSWGHNRVKFQK